MIIEEIIKYNEQFVANKGYEKYLTSKYPDKKLAILMYGYSPYGASASGIGLEEWRCQVD